MQGAVKLHVILHLHPHMPPHGCSQILEPFPLGYGVVVIVCNVRRVLSGNIIAPGKGRELGKVPVFDLGFRRAGAEQKPQSRSGDQCADHQYIQQIGFLSGRMMTVPDWLLVFRFLLGCKFNIQLILRFHMRTPLKAKIQERIVGGIHQQNTACHQQHPVAHSLQHTKCQLPSLGLLCKLFQGFHNREAADYRSDQQIQIVRNRQLGEFIDKAIAANTDQVLEELAQLGQLFKVEDTKADDDNDFGVDMPHCHRDLLDTLFTQQSLKADKDAEIQTPDDIVPACAMPQTRAEPNQEQSTVCLALAEDGDVQQIIPEEGAQRNVPALPELCNVLAQKGMPEVFVKVESEQPSQSDCHI